MPTFTAEVDRELQKRLNQTTKQLNEAKRDLSKTRQWLSDVHDRLTVAEQVTAATQQRELEQSDNSVCELLQLSIGPQSTTDTGNKSSSLLYKDHDNVLKDSENYKQQEAHVSLE